MDRPDSTVVLIKIHGPNDSTISATFIRLPYSPSPYSSRDTILLETEAAALVRGYAKYLRRDPLPFVLINFLRAAECYDGRQFPVALLSKRSLIKLLDRPEKNRCS